MSDFDPNLDPPLSALTMVTDLQSALVLSGVPPEAIVFDDRVVRVAHAGRRGAFRQFRLASDDAGWSGWAWHCEFRRWWWWRWRHGRAAATMDELFNTIDEFWPPKIRATPFTAEDQQALDEIHAMLRANAARKRQG